MAVWTDAERERHFLIPEDAVLPSGDLLLRTAAGRAREVDAEAVSGFEVTAQEVGEWAKGELSNVLGQLKRGLDDALFSKRGQGDQAEQAEPASTTPGLDLLADITDTPRELLDREQGAVGAALRSYLKDAVATTLDGLSDDPERRTNSRRRMREWGETLRAHGIAARDVHETEAGGQEQDPTDDGRGGAG